MSELALRPATELVAMLTSRQISSTELLDIYLERVGRLNPALNAVVTLDAERGRAAAAEADQTIARGEVLGPLHGLPMTVKDVFETAGVRTTSGAPMFSRHVPAQDAVAVRRLREAGAVVFGKTNTPMFAMDVQTYNDVFGTTNNPWDTSRAVGGSSGGSAVAMAVGLSGLELGSDIGGSIRNPAHYSGVYGHKPTYRVIPGRGHIPGPPGTLTQADIAVVGPLARAVSDLELALDVLGGPDDDDAVAWKLTLPPARHEELTDYRVAVWLDDPACPVDSSVGDVLQACVDALGSAGVKIDDSRRPCDLTASNDLYQRLMQATLSMAPPQETFDSLVELAGHAEADDESPAVRWARNVTQRARDWNLALEQRAQLRARWADFFTDFDVLLCPIEPVTAIPHDHRPIEERSRSITVNGERRDYWEQIVWAGLAGMVYLPGTVAPVGPAADGLPVGIQIVGPYLEDLTTIRFAELLVGVVGGYRPPPMAL